MKTFGRTSLLSAAGSLLAAFCLLTAETHAATPGAAQVKKVVGTVTYTDAKGGGPIKEGDILMAGATITTGAGSYVDLDMGVNGNALRVEADSTLALNQLDYTRTGVETIVNTGLEVKKGSTVANVVNKLSKASKYEIKTPAGVAGIRGTVLRAGTTRVVVLIGRVSFTTVNGNLQLTINGGAGFTAGNNNVVSAPTIETAGVARAATALTANTIANMVSQAVQQFTAAVAAEAATEAGKTGGNSAKEAADVAKAVLAQLVQEVQAAAASAPPSVRAQVQAALTQVQSNTEAIGATAAASAAAAAVVNNGGNAQMAKTAATQAAEQATTDTRTAQRAANNVTTAAINNAINAKAAGGTINATEAMVIQTGSASGTPGGNTGQTGNQKTGATTSTDGQTQTFVAPTVGEKKTSGN